MEIILYNNQSENNKVGKTLSGSHSLTGTLRNETNIIDPEILIEYDPRNYNYLYIPEFNRYYFITKIDTVRTDLWRINCSVDVLESFKTGIRALTAIINKQKTLGNQYKNDGSIVMENRQFNTIYNFSGGFNDSGELILITAGANYVTS